MSNITLESVEEQLRKIQQKYESKKKIRNGQKGNLEEELRHLDQELDYLDVSYLTEPYDLTNLESTKKTLSEVVSSSFDLIRLHKENLDLQDKLIENSSKLNSDIIYLKKQIDGLKKALTLKDRQIEITKGQKILESQKNQELKNKINSVNKQISIITSENATKKAALKNINKRMTDENKLRNEKLIKNSGEYVSNDKKIAEVLNEYEKNDEKYKKTIVKLQNTNQDLLAEIIELRNKLSLK